MEHLKALPNRTRGHLRRRRSFHGQPSSGGRLQSLDSHPFPPPCSLPLGCEAGKGFTLTSVLDPQLSTAKARWPLWVPPLHQHVQGHRQEAQDETYVFERNHDGQKNPAEEQHHQHHKEHPLARGEVVLWEKTRGHRRISARWMEKEEPPLQLLQAAHKMLPYMHSFFSRRTTACKHQPLSSYKRLLKEHNSCHPGNVPRIHK